MVAREEARHRKRRIIMNNDGNDFNTATPEEPKTAENFLSKRTVPLVGYHVDTIFYCTGTFNHYTHRSEETELRDGEEMAARYVHELTRLGTDSLETMTRFCHGNSMELFWSMRMNDNHDSSRPATVCQWKRDHPDCLMNRTGPFAPGSWSMLDFAVPEVREKVFRILQDVALRYDIDGVELDFLRHPLYFKAQMKGEPVTQEHCDMMTDLVRRARNMLDEVAEKRGRPMLVAIRVPDSVAYCRAMGLDIVRWLEEKLVDLLTGGGYFKLAPWQNLVTLGHEHDVPVYACLVARRIMAGGGCGEESDLPRWRGEALAAWDAGVDGIYTFNRFNPRDQVLRELGDPELLRSLRRDDRVIYSGSKGYRDPGYWLRDGRMFVWEGAWRWPAVI